jgi:rod shape determining protein RodA
MQENRLRKNLDYLLSAITVLLCVFGEIILYTVTHGDKTPLYRKQIIWMALGAAGMIVATVVDFRIYARASRPLYIINLLLLAVVLVVSHRINGASRWVRIAGFEFQPSETAKLLLTLVLADFLVKHRATIRTPRTLFQSLLLIGIPTLFIFKQPDLGTALVVVAIWAGMVYMAGAKSWHLVLLFITLLGLFVLLWATGKVIKQYQKQRIEVLLGMVNNSTGAGYHVTQARIAIGSGGFWGKGLMHASQVRGGYIPEKQTDFIFTAVGEQLGFVGAAGLLLLYALLFGRIASIVTVPEQDPYGLLIATGILTMIAFHVAVNIGMNVGILPVAGVPLPLVSAGGSNVLVTMYSIGLLQSIRVHRGDITF